MAETRINRRISIVIPVFNEENNIPYVVKEVRSQLQEIGHADFNLLFVDDGSTDHTLRVIREETYTDERISYISLSRNFGHQNALRAGLDHADGDCVISMDGDMQHPPHVLGELLTNWENGFDVVYTLRQEREQFGFKKFSSNSFYKLMNYLSDIQFEKGVADFRLLDRKVVDILKSLPENDLFLRGMVKWVGFRQKGIVYTPDNRLTGKSKYTLKKMMRLAVEGVTSFSIRPLYLAAGLGLFFSAASLLYLPYVLISYWEGHVVSGWGSLIMTVVFFGGLQLSILGIIGIYIGRTFLQTKNRPNYLIRESKLNHVHDPAQF